MTETRSKGSKLLQQTDAQMAEYQSRLQSEQSSRIFQKQALLHFALEHPDVELSQLESAISQLSEVSIDVFRYG